jgi:hypothetical protein
MQFIDIVGLRRFTVYNCLKTLPISEAREKPGCDAPGFLVPYFHYGGFREIVGQFSRAQSER